MLAPWRELAEPLGREGQQHLAGCHHSLGAGGVRAQAVAEPLSPLTYFLEQRPILTREKFPAGRGECRVSHLALQLPGDVGPTTKYIFSRHASTPAPSDRASVLCLRNALSESSNRGTEARGAVVPNEGVSASGACWTRARPTTMRAPACHVRHYAICPLTRPVVCEKVGRLF